MELSLDPQRFAAFRRACTRGLPGACIRVGSRWSRIWTIGNLGSRILVALWLALAGASAQAADPAAADLPAIRSGAHHDNTGAELLLGLGYLEGRYGLTRNPVRAVYWLRRAARDGHPYAQLELGKLYAQGEGVARDPAHAVYWWRRSARSGNREAQRRLGEALLKGYGVSRDPKEAAQWLTRAAEQGDRDAQYEIGKMYRDGYGVPENLERGSTWLSRAAAQGQSDAVKLLHLMEELGQDSSLTFQQSAEVLTRHAKAGDPAAQYELGLRYESGAWDVPRNADKALYWLRASARNGNRHAMTALAHIYDRGLLGVKADPRLAAYWRAQAGAAPR
ncbi:MAG: hypothetical protein B7Z66_13125 [Chromatiales bacterium 21-64-14]|nr:MAG: hypothetical protein B7Z66_13125 [Chromatiales bacterium 21-64-14]HQU15214.1 tetratricopeptide repeat protein [Gammaproteobacteria bacterium]